MAPDERQLAPIIPAPSGDFAVGDDRGIPEPIVHEAGFHTAPGFGGSYYQDQPLRFVGVQPVVGLVVPAGREVPSRHAPAGLPVDFARPTIQRRAEAARAAADGADPDAIKLVDEIMRAVSISLPAPVPAQVEALRRRVVDAVQVYSGERELEVQAVRDQALELLSEHIADARAVEAAMVVVEFVIVAMGGGSAAGGGK